MVETKAAKKLEYIWDKLLKRRILLQENLGL